MQLLITTCLIIYLSYLFYYIFNCFFFYFPLKSRDNDYISENPTVSVLIPARNEERNIKKALDSVLTNDYSNFECIILDDNSTDRTLEILNGYSDVRLKILHGKPLPANWIGKNWACHQLSKAAKGEIILFSDADTFHERDGISRLVKKMKHTNADLLSGFPRQIIGTVGEALVVPFIGLFAFGALPHFLFRFRKLSWASCSNGQYQCFKKQAYDDFGGYSKIYNILADDVAFARKMKSEGKRVVYTECSSQISSRMYMGFKDAFKGFSKSFFPTLGESKVLAVIVFCVISLFFLLPYILLFFQNTTSVWMCLVISVLMWMLSLMNIRANPLYVILHPIVPFVLNSILVHSVISYKNDGYIWKDRVYKKGG
jgi:chlorobactene glucosyltransferase